MLKLESQLQKYTSVVLVLNTHTAHFGEDALRSRSSCQGEKGLFCSNVSVSSIIMVYWPFLEDK